MAQTLGDLLDRIENDNRAKAECETFGHLYPERNKAHYGSIVFAHGCYGDQIIIKADFPTVNASPWFYEDLHTFISDYDFTGVWQFRGSYKKYKNGNCKFTGETKKVYL